MEFVENISRIYLECRLKGSSKFYEATIDRITPQEHPESHQRFYLLARYGKIGLSGITKDYGEVTHNHVHELLCEKIFRKSYLIVSVNGQACNFALGDWSKTHFHLNSFFKNTLPPSSTSNDETSSFVEPVTFDIGSILPIW